ncbi:hypothetical protein [Mycobacteroides franklinii]|uniref:hypothetical protein n=1 Tax=Mycobacteroides franklinii TaxID=948102 RepID=UPI000992A11D|nr:hypothetical protein [Mycobacteroides franklinii]
MSDPAIEAAQRAWRQRHGLGGFNPSSGHDGLGAGYVAAAREALKPIREKIRELQTDIPTDNPMFGEGVDYVIAELAPFIYSSEELATRNDGETK